MKMKLAVVVLFVAVAFLVVRWWQKPGDQTEEPGRELAGISAAETRLQVAAQADTTGQASGWEFPIGEYYLIVAKDRSGSITPAEREIGDQIVQAVSDTVEGRNFLQVAAFANKYETFGSADTEQGRQEVLSRWKRAVQYAPDIQKTNLTVTADNLVRDVIPNIKAGRLAEVIIITDGDHDPPEGQNDSTLIASITSNLDAIPEAYRDRLRIHIVEVGKKIRFAGAVEREIFGGRAKTIRADAWSDVLPIVLQLQSDLTGRFSLDFPGHTAEIGAPASYRPKILGPFVVQLIGPESASIMVDFTAQDAIDAGKQLLAMARVNDDAWLPIPGELLLRDDDRVEFSFRENPDEHLPNFWFSPLQRIYRVKLQAGENLIALTNESHDLTVSLYRDSLVSRYWWIVVLGGFILFLLLAKRVWTIRRRHKRCRLSADIVEPDEFPVVRYGGDEFPLAGEETPVGRIVFRRDNNDIYVTPECLLEIAYDEPQTLRRYQDVAASGEEVLLPNQAELELKDLGTNDVYTVNRKEASAWPTHRS